MEDLNEDVLDEIVIDFTGLDGSEEKLQEFLGFRGVSSLGRDIETILGRMFGMNAVPVTIRGSKTQVSSFARALGSEKRHIETARRLGLTDPRTIRSKADMRKATSEFKRQTGIEWPFK